MDHIVRLMIGITALALVASACGPAEGPPDEPGAPAEVPDSVEESVAEQVAERTGVSPDEVEIVDAEYVEWPDACLGLPEEGEVCAQVITPGWQITAEADDQTLVVRTNDDGTVVRTEE